MLIIAKFKKLKLAGKLVLSLVSVLLAGFLIMFSLMLSNLYTNSINQAESLAYEVSDSYASKISNQFEILKSLGQSLALQVETFRQNGITSREAVIETLKRFMEKNPTVFGITVSYEPNRFDHKDGQNIGKPGSGKDGRFIPYVIRSGNQLAVDKSYDETTDMVWYNTPKDSLKVFLTEPTYYKIDGKDMVMTSVVYPIINQGECIGVVSIDYILEDFQAIVEKIRPLGGFARVITNKGSIVADTLKPELITKNINQINRNDRIIEQIGQGKGFKIYEKSEETQGINLCEYKPIHIEGSDIYWSFCAIIPKRNILAKYYQLQNLILLIAALFIVLIVVIIMILTKRMISTPIAQVKVMLEEMSKGHLGNRLRLTRQDEIGAMAQTMDEFAEKLQTVTVAAIQKIAAGDLNIAIDSVDEQDEISPALAKTVQTLKDIINEINLLGIAAKEGRLNVRGNSAAFTGNWGDLVENFNQAFATIVEPLHEAEQVLKQMAVNDYTLEMPVEKHQGMLRQFAVNINMVRSRLLSVQEALVEAAAGNIGRLEEFRKTGKRSENDRMMPALTGMMQAIQDLLDEVGRLTEAAVGGDLQIRGNAEKFTGGYRQIVTGFNLALDTILEPIKEAFNVLQEMAAGNLDVAVKGDYKGEHALLARAVNHTVDSFNEVLGEFYSASSQVAIGAQHVADSSQVMSQAAAEQAATTEEITASITEIAAQTKHNAENAVQANNLALTAQEQATTGNTKMQNMLESMAAINDSSASISKIIKVIDEIAFQTNILALNAAVEAARAGQYGKGFAVVAEEVRNLAARSANAAKETTVMIESSIQKVTAGTQIANETAESLSLIVAGITRTTALVGDIATASNEQASGIAQVNQGINQIAQVTQSNTGTAEQSAAASEELAGQAELLKEMVQRFQLKITG